MGAFKNIFTWWEGATFGTWLNTRRNGNSVGEDALGNHYFEEKRATGAYKRRWVMYAGINDASVVPPEWHSWLHHMTEDVPEHALPLRRNWEIDGERNPTGSEAAYRPAGVPELAAKRAPATGDYEAWSPEAI